MWGLHLKRKGRWWHYYRSVPREFADVEHKALISFSLKTGDFSEAKRMAAEISVRLEHDWRAAFRFALRMQPNVIAPQPRYNVRMGSIRNLRPT